MKISLHRPLNLKQAVQLSEYLAKLDVQLEKLAAGDPKRYGEDWDIIGKARAIVNRSIKNELDENGSESERSKELDKNIRSVLKK